MGLRRIAAVELPQGGNAVRSRLDLDPGYDDDGAPEPSIEFVDPTELWVDEESYQRAITAKGLQLIRRVAWGSFSWRKFSLPVVTRRPVPGLEGATRLVIIDGQHTATMAATRGIARIPVLVVTTFGLEDEADAFYGQNTNRTAISAVQAHKALVTAGDEEACKVEGVIQASALKMLPFKARDFEPGETIALGTVKALVRRRGVECATKVLKLCVDAGLAPVSADFIKAVDSLMNDEEFSGLVSDGKLVASMKFPQSVTLLQDGGMFAARHRVPTWKGLTTVLFQATQRRKASAA